MAISNSHLDPKYDALVDFPTTTPEGTSGYPGHTTPEQDAKVFQLRSHLEQAGLTERLDTLTMVSGIESPESWLKGTATLSSGSKVQRRPGQEDVSARPRYGGSAEEARFVECEKWRKSFDVDTLVRTFEYKEKPKVFEYYPQYYHKIDKAYHLPRLGNPRLTWAGRPASIH